MSIPLPNKPWNEGDTFTNDETGVEYVYDGVKWLSTGGDSIVDSIIGDYVPKSGGEFEGAIFGPMVSDVVADRDCTLTETGFATNPFDDPTCPEDEIVVNTKNPYGAVDAGIDNRMKISFPKGDAENYVDTGPAQYALVQPSSGSVQVWACEAPSFVTDDGKVLNVTAKDCTGDRLTAGEPIQAWRTDVISSPYVTLEMLRKYYQLVDDDGNVDIGDLDERYVRKDIDTGETMLGPLKILNKPGTASRDHRRLETYGVFSGSESTALRLGTNRDRIYVGDSDTSFNGLVKLDELQEKNAGKNIKVHSQMNLLNNRITRLADPEDALDATNKAYVDEKAEGSTEAYLMALNNEDAILSMRDGMDDFLNPRLVSATENPDFKLNTLFEHAYPLFPDEDDPFYNLIPQRFVLLTRMYEGSKDKTDLNADVFGNDDQPSAVILDTKTGKTRELPEAKIRGPNGTMVYPALRGGHVIASDNGDLNFYIWCHSPCRSLKHTEFDGDTVPLFRIYIPNAEFINDSDPWAMMQIGYSKIRCHKQEFTYPDKNPYGNYEDDTNKYQYEICSSTFKLRDAETGIMHYFWTSYNKQARDYCTQRIFEFTPNPNGDMEYGQIHAVEAHPESTWGSYAGGYHAIKEDINGVHRCFLFGSPVGLTEVYFVDNNSGGRRTEMRNYGDYTPLGERIEDESKLNDIGQPRIVGKGIRGNWYKNDMSAPQWVNKHPMDNNDKLSCMLTYFQGSYGIVSINLQDLGTVDRSIEVKLENNFKGEINALHINLTDNYAGYMEQGSVKNLMRFNANQTDTHSLGSAWYFDYKADYITDERDIIYNDTRVYRNDQLLYQYNFKRAIIEVRTDPIEQDIQIVAHSIGRQRSDTNVEENPTDFSGEGLTKVYDMFVCSSAAKSHSTITKPRVYTFNPINKNISLVDNRESSITSLVPLRKEGLIVGSSYGKNADDSVGTPIYMLEMLAGRSTTNTRKQASVLRKLCEVTGESIADTPDTWELDQGDKECS